MVTPMFGWSAGDIVHSIHIIVKIYEAFKEAGGATSRYAETTAFLEGFKVTLSKLDGHIRRDPDSEYTAEIIQQLKLIDAPYCRFEKFMLDFQPALGAGSTYGTTRKVPRKIKWALKELSAVSGKVAGLKKEVCDPLVLVENLMQLQSLDAIQNIASQLSKLPESAQIETMRDALKDASANILIEIQSHISDLKKAAQRHDEELAGNSKYLARLAESLSDKETRMVNSASEESEKSRQLQVVESVRFIKHVDDVSAIQKRKLDAIINALEKQEQLHSMRNECLTESLRSQQLALDLVDDSVKAFAAKAVDLVVLFDQKMEKVEDHDRYRATKTWLGQFATQLISSGITSAIIGAVVVVSIRAKWDDSDKSNGCVEEEHQRIYSAPRIAAEGQAKVSEMTSDQRECSTNAIKLSSVHVRPPNIPSTFIPNHSPSRKSGQPKRAGLPTSSLASSSSHASSALPHQFSPSNTPRPTSKSSVGNKSYSKHSSTLIDTKISSSSTRTSIQYPTCAATYYDNIHNAPIVRDRGTKNSTLNSSKYSSFVNNTSSRQSQNPLLPSAIFSKSPDLNLWICCRCYRFAGEIEFSHICTFCFHPKCSYCTMRVPAKK